MGELSNFSKKSFDTSRMEARMEKIKKLVHRKIPPCNRCSYKLGMVQSVVNPCPQCELNNYRSFDEFKKQMLKNIGRK